MSSSIAHTRISDNNLNKTTTIPIQKLSAVSNDTYTEIEAPKKNTHLKLNVATMNNYDFLDEDTENNLLENEFKCNSLVKLEEKEYLDQIITTTTTVRTKTTDDLFLLFDTNFYESENTSNLNLSLNNNGSILSIHKINSKNCNHNSFGNINQSVYSCLTNYISK